MKFKMKKTQLLLLLALLVLGGVCFPRQKAYAADTAVRVAAVEYYDENIIVFNNDNTKIYYATDTDAANNNWECVDADAGEFTMIDISWLMPTIQNVLMIKGDKDATVSRIILKEQPSKLNVTINYSNMAELNQDDTIAPLLNIMSSEGTADKPITYSDLEWKKGDNGNWANTDSLTVGMLEKFLVKGANLYFRIRALDDCVTVNAGAVDLNYNRQLGIVGGIRSYAGASFGIDYPDGSQGRRFSEPVRLKIIKKSATMVTGIDGERFTAAIKYGKEYRVTVTYPDLTQDSSNWIQVTDRAIRKIPLSTLVNSIPAIAASGTVFDGVSTAFPTMDIEVRDFATAKTAASQIDVMSLDSQRTLDENIQLGQPTLTGTYTKDDIFVYYFGDKYILLTIPKASADLPYEYCIVKPGTDLNLNTATWNAVTKSTAVKILASKAVEGGFLYVRQKEIKYKAATAMTDAVSYQLASTVVKQKIEYPSTPVVTKASLVYTKGYPPTQPISIQIQLNVVGKLPFETEVTSIKLGSKTIAFTPTLSTPLNSDGSADKSIAYTLTLALKNSDLEALSNCTNRLLTISFKNGIVDKTSVKLTIKSSTAAGSLTLSAEAGQATGNTKLSVVSSVGTGNSWVYTVGATAVSGVNMEDTLPNSTGTAFIPGNDIPVTANQFITVYEIDAGRHIIKYKSIQITSGMIK